MYAFYLALGTALNNLLIKPSHRPDTKGMESSKLQGRCTNSHAL